MEKPQQSQQTPIELSKCMTQHLSTGLIRLELLLRLRNLRLLFLDHLIYTREPIRLPPEGCQRSSNKPSRVALVAVMGGRWKASLRGGQPPSHIGGEDTQSYTNTRRHSLDTSVNLCTNLVSQISNQRGFQI